MQNPLNFSRRVETDDFLQQLKSRYFFSNYASLINTHSSPIADTINRLSLNESQDSLHSREPISNCFNFGLPKDSVLNDYSLNNQTNYRLAKWIHDQKCLHNISKLTKLISSNQFQSRSANLSGLNETLNHIALLNLSNNCSMHCGAFDNPANSHHDKQTLQSELTNEIGKIIQSEANLQNCEDNKYSGHSNKLSPLCTLPNKSQCKTTHETMNRYRSQVVIHQIGNADDHFTKALKNQGMNSRIKHTNFVHKTKSAPEIIHLEASTKEKIHNIADLAVEKHFEKSLANFHANEQCSKTPLDLSLYSSRGPEFFLSSKQYGDQNKHSTMELPLKKSCKPSSIESVSSELEVCTGLSASSYNPKKNWLAQYDKSDEKEPQAVNSNTYFEVHSKLSTGRFAELLGDSEIRPTDYSNNNNMEDTIKRNKSVSLPTIRNKRKVQRKTKQNCQNAPLESLSSYPNIGENPSLKKTTPNHLSKAHKIINNLVLNNETKNCSNSDTINQNSNACISEAQDFPSWDIINADKCEKNLPTSLSSNNHSSVEKEVIKCFFSEKTIHYPVSTSTCFPKFTFPIDSVLQSKSDTSKQVEFPFLNKTALDYQNNPIIVNKNKQIVNESTQENDKTFSTNNSHSKIRKRSASDMSRWLSLKRSRFILSNTTSRNSIDRYILDESISKQCCLKNKHVKSSFSKIKAIHQ